MSHTLFISDLHLDESRPGVTQCFLRFLEQNKGQIDALYILGDLFEIWIGDDAVPQDHPVLLALKDFASVTPTYLTHGNRDFLVGEQFCTLTDITLLPDFHIVDLYGERALLMHGDSLCIDDIEYMKFRATVRSRQWIEDFLSNTVAQRIEIARSLREQSKSENAMKSDEIMDVNEEAVADTFDEYNVNLMIHGHTHRPHVHEYTASSPSKRRIVLGDWYDQGSVLHASAHGCKLLEIPFK